MQYSLWYVVPNTLLAGDLVTYWVQHTTSYIAQSKVPEDGQNCCPKHVELNWIYQLTIIVAFSWLSCLPSVLMMDGQTNIKLKPWVVVKICN